MKASRNKALRAAGVIFEDAEDFLELTEEERNLVQLRLAVWRADATDASKLGEPSRASPAFEQKPVAPKTG